MAFLSGATATLASDAPRVLGRAPLCEASASLRVSSDPVRVWIADNEVPEHLFRFEVSDGYLVPAESWKVEIPQDGAPDESAWPRDVEALAGSDTEIAIVGSHSRKAKCGATKGGARKAIRWVRRTLGGMEHSSFHSTGVDAYLAGLATPAACLDAIFSGAEGEVERAVCAALVAAETESNAEACLAANVEGAVIHSEDGRLWLGLRSPLAAVGQARRPHAILLRARSRSADTLTERSFRFDGGALVDLDGRGVRELTPSLRGDALWIVAGPPVDGGVPHFLYRLSMSRLQPSAVLQPFGGALLALPTSTEGLVPLSDGAGIALIDGREGEAGECEVPARQQRIALPE